MFLKKVTCITDISNLSLNSFYGIFGISVLRSFVGWLILHLMDSLVRLMYRGVDIIDRDMNKLSFKCEYWRLLLSVPHTLWVRLRGWVSQEEARESRCLMDCFPAASPSPGADRARWCAGCESGRAAGKPGWSEPATEPSQATATPENEERCLQSRIEKTLNRHMVKDNDAESTQEVCEIPVFYYSVTE